MMKAICLLSLLLAACTAGVSVPTSTSTVMLLPPSPTIQPSATPDPFQPIIDVLQEEGITVEHRVGNADGGWGLIVDGVDVPAAYFDEDGQAFHIQIGDELLDIPPDEAADRLRTTEDGVLVVMDKEGNAIAAFGPQLQTEKWNGRWISESEIMQADGMVVLENYEEYFELVSPLEGLFVGGFPDSAYMTEGGYKDYDHGGVVLKGDKNTRYPLGTREDLSTSPFRFVNQIVVKVDDYYACIVTQAVKNIDDSVSRMHFAGMASSVDECRNVFKGLRSGADGIEDGGEYLLPNYSFSKDALYRYKWARVFRDFYKMYHARYDYIDEDGHPNPAYLKDLVDIWFADRILPEEFEEILFFGSTSTFKKWD
jgi:hypothetical protein